MSTPMNPAPPPPPRRPDQPPGPPPPPPHHVEDRLEAAFNAVLGRAPAEREAYLAEVCAGDEALAGEVRRLLAAQDAAGDFLRATTPLSPEIEAELARLKPEKAGDRIGPYKLLQQIGEGGFGVVWMAEQEQLVRRRVALKIIKLGMTARVQQGAASGGAQVVTLSPGNGESFTLGSALSNTGGNTNSLVKTGQGTAMLTIANTYTGGTTISGGVLNVFADAALGISGGVAISNGATLQAGGTLTSNRLFNANGGVIDTNGQIVTLDTTSTVTGSALTKAGTGTLNIKGTQTYGALTTAGGVTNIYTALGAGTSSLTANATTNIYASQTLASLTIGNGAVVTFGDGANLAPTAIDGNNSFAGSAALPEPGAMGLLLVGALGLLDRRRRPA